MSGIAFTGGRSHEWLMKALIPNTGLTRSSAVRTTVAGHRVCQPRTCDRGAPGAGVQLMQAHTGAEVLKHRRTTVAGRSDGYGTVTEPSRTRKVAVRPRDGNYFGGAERFVS